MEGKCFILRAAVAPHRCSLQDTEPDCVPSYGQDELHDTRVEEMQPDVDIHGGEATDADQDSVVAVGGDSSITTHLDSKSFSNTVSHGPTEIIAKLPAGDPWNALITDFRKYCDRQKVESSATTHVISQQINKIETDTLAHIQPNVFLIDRSSDQPLPVKQTIDTITDMEPSSLITDPTATAGSMRLRSGKTLGQEADDEMTDSVDAGETVSHVPLGSQGIDEAGNRKIDAEYQEDDSGGSQEGDGDFEIDADEVAQLADVEKPHQTFDDDDVSLIEESEVPESHIVVRGCPSAIPIWEYLGKEFTQDIVSLLEEAVRDKLLRH